MSKLAAFAALTTYIYAQSPCISFAARETLSGVGPTTKGLAIAEFNGDSRNDVAYLTAGGFAIAFNAAEPGIRFLQPVLVPAGAGIGIDTADFDGDGKTDVVILKAGSVEVWRNTSTGGSFSFAQAYTATLAAPTIVMVAEMNRDGKPDIVTLSAAELAVQRNTSAGSVSFVSQTGLGGGGLALALGDRDGDGDADPVVFGGSTFNFTLLNFFANGAVGGAVSLSQTGFGSGNAVPGQPAWVGTRLVDVTRDSQKDVVAGAGQTLIVVAGNLSSFVISPVSLIPLGATILDVEVADVNGDGAPDAIAYTSAGVKIALNTTAAPGFAFTGAVLDFGLAGGSEIAVGNFSGDAQPDILATGFSSSRIVPLVNGALPMLLSASPNPVAAGEPFELTAVALPACGAPSGSISFSRGAIPLGTVPLNGLTARLTTTFSAGIQTMTASFTPSAPGSPFSEGSASATVFVDAGSCATSVAQASVQAGALRYDRVTNQYVQTVSIRNDSGAPLTGPVSLALANLTPGVTLAGGFAATGCAVPSGTPYVNFNVCTGGSVAPGATLSTTLRFSNPQRVAIRYQPAVLAGYSAR